jgi:aminomethyltransferase
MTRKRTALYAQHVASGARMVAFAGWELPLHYGSQLEEHHCVRREAGVFDVSHMTMIDVTGRDARAYLRHLLAADIAGVNMFGRALYSCMLNEQGGIVDDLIVYCLAENRFRVVANAATREKDLAWMRRHAQDYTLTLSVCANTAMLAVQGPDARARLLAVLGSEDRARVERLKYFDVAELPHACIARTGYTGEDGFELMLPDVHAPALWQRLVNMGVAPAGLGARDTLRLEAGLNLYGSDMDDDTTPAECGLGWTVSLGSERDFVGRQALVKKNRIGVVRKRVGLVIEDRGVPRAHQKVIADGTGEGEVTSGTFSPTLGVSIALARVPTATGGTCEVENRGRRLKARVVKPPFVRHGKPCGGILQGPGQ